MEPIAADVFRVLGQIRPGGMDIDQVYSHLGAYGGYGRIPPVYLGAQSNGIITEKMREESKVRYVADEDPGMSLPA
jgi:hypothetical protein